MSTGCARLIRLGLRAVSRCAAVVDTPSRPSSCVTTATASTTGAAMSSARPALRPCRLIDADETRTPTDVYGLTSCRARGVAGCVSRPIIRRFDSLKFKKSKNDV